MTQQERNRIQRIQRVENGNAHTKKYEKTKRGFLMRLYRNMQSRITGVQAAKHHLYKGKSLLDRALFYEWANAQPDFHSLFSAWEESNYDRRHTPSVDRVDSSRGYDIDNMEWVTHSENSRRGSISKWRGKTYDRTQ